MSTIFLQRAIFFGQKQVFLGEHVRVETWPDIFLLLFKKKSVNVPSLFLNKNSSLNNWRYFRSPKTVKSVFLYLIKPSRNNQLRVPQYMSPADLPRKKANFSHSPWFWLVGVVLMYRWSIATSLFKGVYIPVWVNTSSNFKQKLR